MPTDGLPIELDAVRELIRQLAPNVGDEFTTIQIIERYSGGYHINRGVAPARSLNAKFGKYIRRHEAELDIESADPTERSVLLEGSPTTTAVWRRKST